MLKREKSYKNASLVVHLLKKYHEVYSCFHVLHFLGGGRQGVVFCKPRAVFPAVIHASADCKIVSGVSQIEAKHSSALDIMIL